VQRKWIREISSSTAFGALATMLGLTRRYIVFWDKETAHSERLADEPAREELFFGFQRKEEAGTGCQELVTYSGSTMVD